MTTLIDVSKLVKEYSGVRVLKEVDFQLQPGEVHVLFGENGAGKSTLISIIAGAQSPTSGELRFKGNPVRIHSVHQARALGISAVFQEFSLIPQMTVEENIFLGSELTHWGIIQKKQLHNHVEKLINDLDFHLSPKQKIKNLTRAEQQMVEIAKAFRSDLSVLILDEPTASLTHHETDRLFKLIEKLKADGVGIIYITHRMAELREIGDRITVLRDGKYIDTVSAKTTSESELVNLMTGRVFGQIYPEIDFNPKEEILHVNRLTTRGHTVVDASMYLKRGEIVGFTGLVGSGKSAFAQACYGIEAIERGEIVYKGEDVTGFSIQKMLDRGFLYLPSDRFTEGLMRMRSAKENMSLPSISKPPFAKGFFLDRKFEVKKAHELAEHFSLTPPKIDQNVEFFSGGNQQKIMISRCLTQNFDVIVFDEPTVGVDIGARIIIYDFISELCKKGVAILLISSDLPEVLHLCNRAYVFYRGMIQAELHDKEITEENILSHFFEREAV